MNAINMPGHSSRQTFTERPYEVWTSDQSHTRDSQYPCVQLYVTDLPANVTTWNIYENFKAYGELSNIKILESQADGRGRRAEVRFTLPISRWPRRIRFVCDGHSNVVTVRPSNYSMKNEKIDSPVHKGVKYDEKTELLGKSIKFGVLLEPGRMMTLQSRGSRNENVKLVLQLRLRQIEVFFPSTMESNSGQAIRNFRFQIALDDEFKIWSVPGEGYILHLKNAPRYSKQLKEAIAQTHARDGKKWSIEDTWARQTDIVYHKKDLAKLNQTPISVQKQLNSINVARWTTFKINTLDTAANNRQEVIFQQALKDFNVEVLDGTNFRIVRGPPKADDDAWNLLDGRATTNQPRTLAEELYSCNLPFHVRYQLEVCISKGWLSEYSISSEFIQKLAEIAAEEGSSGENKLEDNASHEIKRAIKSAKARQMLMHVDSLRERVWNPMDLFTKLRYRQPVKFKQLPNGCMEVRSATVTATSILLHTPAVEVTNRVIRKYKQHIDRFLRVRFEDDSFRGQTILRSASNNKMIQVFQRVKRVLRHGIILADRHYEFLAWGNSQLREHGVYFFAKTVGVSAASIRDEMGAFDQEKVVAKRTARMGQCFSTTRPIHLTLPAVTKLTTITDIKRGRWNFTDGVGMISTMAAQMIQHQLRIKGPLPSLFQFRLGGCKGVLVVWPHMSGIDLKVRDSQLKFPSTSNELEIIRWSEFWQTFLNRQIIICLSDLGVPDSVFLRMQDETIKALEAALIDDRSALKALRDNVDPNGMTLGMCKLVEAGFRASAEPFVMSLMHLWRAWTLKYLKEKARIPVRHGAFVLGCADEKQLLRGHFDSLDVNSDGSTEARSDLIPEIFIQITDPQLQRRRVITGLCVLARNPSLHRGDIRVVRAVDVPELRHLCDVVVMPTCGDRDLPSMCSGGDLDGDDYIVIWDKELIPATWNAEPFHYEQPAPRVAAKEITTEDIIDFFYDYLQNDQLGRIAHAHMAAADYLDDGIQSQDCLELAHLHSMAVDYAKTGVPAIMEPRLERTTWPHFMEKRGSYKSKKVLGQLYDAVECVAFEPQYDSPFDQHLLNSFKPDASRLESIIALKNDYDNSLQRIMSQHDIKTEFEVFSTFVLSHSKASRDYKFHEEIGNLSLNLKEQYRQALQEIAGGEDYEHLAPVAVAAYEYTREQVQLGLREIKQGLRMEGSEGMPFISFPWVLQDVLCSVAKDCRVSNSGKSTNQIKLAGQVGNSSLDGKSNTESSFQFPETAFSSNCMPDPLIVDNLVSEAAKRDHDLNARETEDKIAPSGTELIFAEFIRLHGGPTPDGVAARQDVSDIKLNPSTNNPQSLDCSIQSRSSEHRNPGSDPASNSQNRTHKGSHQDEEQFKQSEVDVDDRHVEADDVKMGSAKVPFASLRRQLGMDKDNLTDIRSSHSKNIDSWLADVDAGGSKTMVSDLPARSKPTVDRLIDLGEDTTNATSKLGTERQPGSSSKIDLLTGDGNGNEELTQGSPEQGKTHCVTGTEPMGDPLNMSMEEMRALGFDDDMELKD